MISFTPNTPGSSNIGQTTQEPGPALTGAGGSFPQLEFKSLGNLTLIQGDHEELVIDADDSIRSHIRSEVHNATLTISFDHGWNWFDFGWWGSNRIEYRLTMREINGLSFSGAGKLFSSQIKTDMLKLEHRGAGEITINNLEANQLSVRLQGAGNTILTGSVSDQDVVLSGAGSYRARNLQSKTGKVTLSGVGSATVRVSDTLDARLSGVGSLEYYGSPKVSQQISGIGKIKSLGNR